MSYRMMPRLCGLSAVPLASVVCASVLAGSSESAQNEVVTPETLRSAITALGDFDYAVRMNAARTVRRAARELAVPALIGAATAHEDSYVQFRALVLLFGFGDARGAPLMAEVLDHRNDRLRAAAYAYFEQEPDPTVVPRLLAALDREASEFVRPPLVRALAAHASDRTVRAMLAGEVDRGEAFFRSVAIEALGDYRAEYAVEALLAIATEDGPLQDDAILALGKIGDRRAQNLLADVRRLVPPARQPIVSAAVCLLGIDCEQQRTYIIDALGYVTERGGNPELLRNAATALAALATNGDVDAAETLFNIGVPATEPARAPIALALGAAALRRPGVVLEALERPGDLEPRLLLLRDAFDMLEEDFAEERFFVLMRQAYYASESPVARRTVAEAAMRVLEF